MKNTQIIIIVVVALCFSMSCRDGAEEAFSLFRADGFPTLSNKNVALRLSYDVETVNRASFEEGQDLPPNYTGLEVPVVEKKSLFYEVYEDNTIAYGIKIFEPFNEGDWSKIKMIRLITVMNGQMNVYDAGGDLLLTEAKSSYSIDPSEVEASGMDYIDFIKEKMYRPSQVYKVALELLSKESVLTERQNGTITFRIPERSSDPTVGLRVGRNDYDVIYREITYYEEQGIPVYELAYNATGDIIEELTYYYKTENSGERVLSIERFARLVFSEADQIEYTDVSEYFYSNLEVTNS
jgi:hypothetical protein